VTEAASIVPPIVGVKTKHSANRSHNLGSGRPSLYLNSTNNGRIYPSWLGYKLYRWDRKSVLKEVL